MEIRITGVEGIPDIREGDDLAALIRAAAPPITANVLSVLISCLSYNRKLLTAPISAHINCNRLR